MNYFIRAIIILFLLASVVSEAQNTYRQLREQAEKHLSEGKLGEAIDLLNKYISAAPDKADGYNLRGTAFEKRGNYESAVRDFYSAYKLQPQNKNYASDLKRAREAWDKLLVNQIEGYKREIAIDPGPAKNYLQVGRAYNWLEDYRAAEIWYDEYLKREEASADEILRYTEILAKLEKYSKGLPILKRYTTMFPGDHRLWSRYGYFNLWSGNRTKAIEAFEESLKIRPFFKEAMEGLEQAKGKGYNYTYTTVRTRGQVYLIDKYFRQLKSTPDNNEIRLQLIKELMNHKRYEEAYQQLEILRPDSSSFSEFSQLWQEASEQRKTQHVLKIDELRASYNKNKGNRDVILQLARRYSYIEEYDSSAYFYSEYLKLTPGDLPARFEYAKVLAWNLDYNRSKEEVSLLLSLDPLNREYQLLYATLSVWMLEDLDKAEEYLEGILAEDPDNLEALISMIALKIQKKDFTAAETLLQQAKILAPENERIVKLESDLDFHKLRAEEEKNFQKLEAGRVLAMENKCREALALYEEYMQKTEPNRMVLREYADVNACAGNYAEAIKIYDDLLKQEYDFETDLQRAKVYYWSGDSLSALKEFTRLYKSNPDNFDVRMYLGDTYTKLKMHSDARKVYNDLLASGLDSTKAELINLRIGWLPVGRAAFGAFPEYIMVTPSALYYDDNLGFSYNAQSLRLDLGLTSFMTLAPEASAGFISSDEVRKSFSSFKGNLLFRFSDKLTTGGGFGLLLFSKFDESIIADAFLRYEKPELYSLAFNFIRQDAAQVLYSPELVDVRLSTNLYRLSGFYKFNSGIKLSGFLNRVDVSDDNTGYFLELEAGKYFTEKFYAGYEFYSVSFRNISTYYFSPADYSSHSITAEYDFIKEKVNRLTVGGKLGLISNSDYILKEIYAGGIYSLFNDLALQARISYGSTLQNDLGYSSFSAQLAAYWFF